VGFVSEVRNSGGAALFCMTNCFSFASIAGPGKNLERFGCFTTGYPVT
jgi:hypothetical protein